MTNDKKITMKVAISTDGDSVAPHFGRCESYTIAEIENGEIKSRQSIGNPGHEPGFLPRYLDEQGVTCIVAGGMGSYAKQLFDQKNIQTLMGVSGKVDDTLAALAAGELQTGESTCVH